MKNQQEFGPPEEKSPKALLERGLSALEISNPPHTVNAIFNLYKAGEQDLVMEVFKYALDRVTNDIHQDITQINHWPEHVANSYEMYVQNIFSGDNEEYKRLHNVGKTLINFLAAYNETIGFYIRAAEKYEYLGMIEKKEEMIEKDESIGSRFSNSVFDLKKPELDKLIEWWDNEIKDRPTITLEEVVKKIRTKLESV